MNSCFRPDAVTIENAGIFSTHGCPMHREIPDLERRQKSPRHFETTVDRPRSNVRSSSLRLEVPAIDPYFSSGREILDHSTIRCKPLR